MQNAKLPHSDVKCRKIGGFQAGIERKDLRGGSLSLKKCLEIKVENCTRVANWFLLPLYKSQHVSHRLKGL